MKVLDPESLDTQRGRLVFLICIIGGYFYYFCLNPLWVCIIAWRELLIPSLLQLRGGQAGIRTPDLLHPKAAQHRQTPPPAQNVRAGFQDGHCVLHLEQLGKGCSSPVCANYVATTVLERTPVTKTSFQNSTVCILYKPQCEGAKYLSPIVWVILLFNLYWSSCELQLLV